MAEKDQTEKTYDAVLVPPQFCEAKNAYWTLVRLNALAESLLRPQRSIAWREQPGGWPSNLGAAFAGWLGTRHPYDTLLFPNGHPREGDARYTWTRRDDGVWLGTYVEGAAATAVDGHGI